MEPRALCYRNAERTNRLLELVCLRLNRCDGPLGSAKAIRKNLDGGTFGMQGTIRDPAGQSSLRV